MSTLRILYYMIRTDILERTRRYSFLIMLGIIIFMGYSFLPPIEVIKAASLKLGIYRGVYNSAWVGASIAMITSTILSLPAFYLVKNAVERDNQSRVGQIIATTPLSKPLYTLGKALSNFAFLSIMVFVIIAAAFLTQLIRGESFDVDLWALASPFIFSVLPVMGMVAALAVLFETIPFLRGGLGNIIYFILCIFSITMSSTLMGSRIINPSTAFSDFYGISTIINSMRLTCWEVYPGYDGSIVLGVSSLTKQLETFLWKGIQWDWGIIVGRLLWFLVAVLCAFLASVFFNRFDTSAEGRKMGKAKRRAKVEKAATLSNADRNELKPVKQVLTLTPLSAAAGKPNLLEMVLAELRLTLKGTSIWWHLAAAGIIAAGFLTPLQVSRQYILPAALIWPLLKFSSLGTREKFNRTAQIILSTPYTLTYQLFAAWASGLLIAFCMCSPALFRLLAAGDMSGAYALTAGILFIPSLALASGIWVGNSKMFEVIYMIMWYMGPLNKMAILDFAGTTGEVADPVVAAIYLALSVVLAILAFSGRYAQIKFEHAL